MDIDSRIAGLTVRVVVPDTEPEAAATTVEPVLKEVVSPDAFTVATAGVPDVQLTILVKSAVLVSLKVPVALNCCVTSNNNFPILLPLS